VNQVTPLLAATGVPELRVGYRQPPVIANNQGGRARTSAPGPALVTRTGQQRAAGQLLGLGSCMWGRGWVGGGLRGSPGARGQGQASCASPCVCGQRKSRGPPCPPPAPPPPPIFFAWHWPRGWLEVHTGGTAANTRQTTHPRQAIRAGLIELPTATSS
jgi:hypothetical protein